MDFFVRTSAENAARIITVLQSFGFTGAEQLEPTLVTAGKVVQLGRPPNRIDLLTGIDGVTFEQAVAGAIEIKMDELPVRMIGLEDLLKNKAAAGRPKDLADLLELKKTRKA